MNIHVSDDIREKWPQYEFVGKPFRLSNGKTYIKCKHRVRWEGHTHVLCIEDNWIWHDVTADEIVSY